MNFRIAYSFALVVLLAFSGCGDDDGHGADTGTADTGGTDTGSDGGADDAGDDAGPADSGSDTSDDAGDSAMMATGDCETSADCDGRECVELVAGGWKVCVDERVEVTECSDAPGLDQCACDDAPICEGGVACVLSPLSPFCGGIMMQPSNVCAIDQCSSDEDCGENSFCLPAPVLGRQVRACFGAACQTAADCTAAPGGICAPVADPCCGIAGTLACVYPDGCRRNADCADGMSCQFRDGAGVCTDDPVICPA